MADQTVQRRLAAILAADVAGYTQLMEKDAEGTVAAWQAARADVIRPNALDHSGKLVKLTGDGFLIEFPTVLDAVNCAVAVQKGLVSSTLDFRIGVHMGDIIDDGEDIHGEGVNVAARLEGLADAGGICISGSVHEQVRNRIDVTFEDLGEKEVKNVSAPVRVYAIRSDNSVTTPASVEQAVADKPSIAVLPFDNMSGDPEQEYFSDGITEDIITGLSKIPWLFVIARNSSFTFKGQPVDVKFVGLDLGVQYVLEGSVRRGGKRVRVTAQLIEVESGHHVWADRYDGDLDNIFELQDEITEKILSAIGPELTMAEVGRTSHKRAHDFSSWDRYLQALPFAYEITKAGFGRAVGILEESLELDPNFSNAYALLCYCYSLAAYQGWTSKVRDAIEQSIEYGEKAVALDPLNPMTQTYLGWAYVHLGPQEKAARVLHRALELDPNSAAAWAALGVAFGFMGEPEQALEAVVKAKRGSPRDPMRWQWLMAELIANFAAGRLENAVEAAKIVIHLQPSWFGAYPLLAASAAHLGRMDVAGEAIEALLERIPRYSMKGVERNPMYERPDDAKRIIDGLRLAGLPEG